MHFQPSRVAVGLSCLLGAMGAFRISPASACGGFFCDRPAVVNAGPPIAQAAENVVFALDRDPATGVATVEAHIQIKYAGAADQFSWIVPMTSPPTLSAGSDVLFQILEPKTRPTFTTQFTTQGTCKGSGGASVGCGGASDSGGTSAPSGSAFDHNSPAVDVSFHGNVGPFDAAVVHSDDAAALQTWLTDHDYFVSPEAMTIIKAYVAKGIYFVALRLQAGRDVDEIQPIVVKLASEEGCLPLMLTAIAATPNVRINVWVLGSGRAVPLNFDEIVPNLAKLDWLTGGANYDQIVSDAANEAGGNAFLAEYAQPTTSAATGWFTVSPDAVARLAASISPGAFVATLQALGLPLNGRVLQVLRVQIPEPANLIAQGVTEANFYAQLQFNGSTSATNFKPAAAAAQIDTDVLQPMRALLPLFTNHAYLTRLATFISPEEMTKDPLFVTNRTLPALSNLHAATAYIQCGDEDFEYCAAPIRLEIEGGRSLRFASLGGGACSRGTTGFDRGTLDVDLPSAEQSWRRDADGPGTQMIDNSAVIATAIRNHNWGVPTPGGGNCAVGARGGRRSWLAGLTLIAALLVARVRRRR